MADAPHPGNRAALLLILLTLFGIGWFCLDRLEENRESTIRIQNTDSLRNLLPLMRERIEPVSLAHEKMLAGLHGFKTLDNLSAQRITSRWVKAFGSAAHYGLWRRDGSLIAANGFTPEDLEAFRVVMTVRQYQETLGPSLASIYGMYGNSMVRLFGNVLTLLDRDPLVIHTMTVLGRNGQLMMGPWFPSMDIGRESLLQIGKSPKNAVGTASDCAGLIALFVPHEKIRSPRWLRHALAMPTAVLSLPRMHLVRLPALYQTWNEIPGLTAELAHMVLAAAGKYSEGTFLSPDMTGIAFVKKPGSANIIAIHIEDMPRPFRLARSSAMPGICLLFFLILISGLHLEAAGKATTGLFRQCLLICAIVSCIPVSGLVWTSTIGAQGIEDSRRSDAMQRLEQRMEQIEANHASYISTLVKPIRRYLDDPRWRQGIFRPNDVESDLKLLTTHFLQGLYVIEKDGKPHYFTLNKEYEFRSTIKQVVTLITALLQFIQSTLLANEESAGLDQRQILQRELKGGMVYDVLSLAVGPESIYRLALVVDQLVPFQIFHEATWIIFHHVFDEAHRPMMILFAVMHRKNIVQNELTKIACDQTPSPEGTPRLVLMHNDEREWPLVYPVRACEIPPLLLMLRHIRREGGNIKSEIIIDGIPCYILARPLNGMEMVAAAIEPVAASKAPEISPGLMAAAYPAAILVLVLMLFQSFLLRPVIEMSHTVEGIAAGDYGRRLPVLTDDEIGSLCLSFNRMAHGLEEKEFLRRFISDLTMQAVAGRHRQMATRLTATVMFTDIRGFTTISETEPPEKIVAMLNDYLTRMETVIESNGGTIDKFIGDAIMAVFLPTHGMAPSNERAVRAAFGMRRELDAFNKARRAAGEFTIANGSGIATGEILMGVLGRSDGRQDFTVTGPTVNKAAAMEKRSKETRRMPIVACPATIAGFSATLELDQLAEIPGKPDGFEIVSVSDFEVS